MKEQAQSDRDREQAALDHENVVCEEVLRQLNDQLQAQITALHNNRSSTQSEREPGVDGSSNLRVLDKLIQRWIVEAKLQGDPMPSVAKISGSL